MSTTSTQLNAPVKAAAAALEAAENALEQAEAADPNADLSDKIKAVEKAELDLTTAIRERKAARTAAHKPHGKPARAT